MTKFATGGDPAWASAFNNIAGMFDPKVEAEGAALRAKRASLESDARYNNARAIGAEDQNSALGEAYLASVGYTPQEIAAIRAARSGSVYDIAHGQNAFRGRTAMEAGNAALALPLLGQATAYDDFVKGMGTQTLMKDPTTGAFNYPLAAALAGGAHNVGGNLAELTPQGWVLRGPTEQGKVFQGQVVNNAAESNATVGLTDAKTQVVQSLGTAREATEEERARRIAAAIANDAALADAVVGLNTARTDRVTAGTANDKAKADASVKSVQDRTKATVDATNSKAANANDANALKDANNQANLRTKIDRVLDTAYAKRTNNGKAWALLDPAQKRSIVDWATQRATDNGGDVVSAIKEAEAAHKVNGGATEGVNKGWFTDSGNGVMSLNGFTPSTYKRQGSPVANAVVSDAQAPATGGAPAAPTAPATSAAVEPMPTEKDKLVVGKSYQTPKGVLKWDGNRFVSP